jgi:hypothetical protein
MPEVAWTLYYADGRICAIIASGDVVDGALLTSNCPFLYFNVYAMNHRGCPSLRWFSSDGREDVDAEGLLSVCAGMDVDEGTHHMSPVFVLAHGSPTDAHSALSYDCFR